MSTTVRVFTSGERSRFWPVSYVTAFLHSRRRIVFGILFGVAAVALDICFATSATGGITTALDTIGVFYLYGCVWRRLRFY